MGGMIVISICAIAIIAMFSTKQTAERNKIFNSYEQWAISHPYEAQRVMNESISYREFLTLVTGKDHGEGSYVVNYIPREDGNYEFCLKSEEQKSSSSYRYSSETQKVEYDKTCNV